MISCLICISSFVSAQQVKNLLEQKTFTQLENIHVTKLFEDSLSSSFLIVIRNEVAAHKHIEHSEHVYVIEGEADFVLNETLIKIKPGDFIFIPKNTIHKLTVTSKIPMKAISIQAPYFNGSDRILIKELNNSDEY